MEGLSHKYILLQDRVGYVLERCLLSLGLSTKQSPMQVLRGELLEALPEVEQPKDSSKIALVGIDRKSLRLECGMECIIRLTEEDANLLLAISSLEERYQTYMDRIRLDFGRKIGPGSKVYVTVKGVSKVLPGVVWYKGELLSCNGSMFGVELIDNPGQGTSDGTFRNRRYFTCPPDSGVFVGLDKLTPRDDSISKSSKRAESSPSNIASRIKETVMPSFLKGKNEENCAQGDTKNQEVENILKTGQRVVTFIKNDRTIRGTVRYIGKDRGRQNGEMFAIVGLELDKMDGCGTGKLHGRQLFVCRKDFALFVPIETVIPEEVFDENPVNARGSSLRTSERVDNVEEQIHQDERLAKSLSCDAYASSSGGASSKRARRTSSFEDSASVIKAAGESSKTDPTQFIEQQQQLLDQIKISKASDHNDEDVVMRDDERTDSATKLSFDEKHFRSTPPNSDPITTQPGLSSALPGYHDYEVIDKKDYENAKREQRHSRDGMPADYGIYETIRTPSAGEVATEYNPRVYGNTRNSTQLAGEIVTDYSPGTSHKPEVDMLSKEQTENLQSQSALLYTEESAGAEGQTAVDIPHGYEVGSMVEVPMAQGLPRYGVIRWIGLLPELKDKLVAGLELEEEQSACSDGTFNSMRYFTCPAGRGFFTLLQHCRQDSRFTPNSPNNDNSFHSGKAFGSLPSPDVPGITLPPPSLEDKHCGTMHGIQGHHNSCYLDATLYSMFAFSSVFDTLLHRGRKKDTDLAEYDEVQRVLRESIVNPLRTTGFVRADRVLKLRELLDKLSSTAGLVNEEKDPEEFLNSLLQQVLKADPFLHLKSRDARKKDSEGAFFYQIITEKDETVKIAQVQQLLELSFISADIILSELPSCLILQMPRFGSKYKMYDMILPNLELDVAHIVENIPRECVMCGSEIARFECKDCQIFTNGIRINSYCSDCNDQVHKHRDRSNHRPRPLLPPRQFHNSKQIAAKHKMELFAVVCIETSHYVAFVKCGVGADAPWCFFDSMADRKGEKNGYNIPAVSACPEALEWLSKDPKEIIAAKERGEIPEKVRRLLGDGYLCMYQDLDMTMYK